VTPWENGSLLYAVTNHVKAVAFGFQKILPVTRDVESHNWSWGRKHFRGAHLGRKFWNFLSFKIAHFGVLYIF